MLLTGRSQVRQSFSRLRLIAPHLAFVQARILRPCLVAPIIDSASLEPVTPLLKQARILCTVAAQERVTNQRLLTYHELMPPPSIFR